MESILPMMPKLKCQKRVGYEFRALKGSDTLAVHVLDGWWCYGLTVMERLDD